MYMFMYMYMYMYVYTSAYIYMCVFCVCMCMHMYTYVSTYPINGNKAKATESNPEKSEGGGSRRSQKQLPIAYPGGLSWGYVGPHRGYTGVTVILII